MPKRRSRHPPLAGTQGPERSVPQTNRVSGRSWFVIPAELPHFSTERTEFLRGSSGARDRVEKVRLLCATRSRRHPSGAVGSGGLRDESEPTQEQAVDAELR